MLAHELCTSLNVTKQEKKEQNKTRGITKSSFDFHSIEQWSVKYKKGDTLTIFTIVSWEVLLERLCILSV